MFAKYVMVCAVLSGILTGCGATKQARSVTMSGFLQDLYPEMREGKGDEDAEADGLRAAGIMNRRKGRNGEKFTSVYKTKNRSFSQAPFFLRRGRVTLL
jgi:hypothetical protein